MKRVFLEEYVLIDLESNQFKFQSFELISQKNGLYIFKLRNGKLGNSGKFTFKEFKDYKQAYEYYKNKKTGLLNEGFIKKEVAISKMKDLFKPTSPKKYSKNERLICGSCKNELSEESYSRLKQWSEGEGNWKESNNDLLLNNVICIECQKKIGIFKKKF